MCVRLFCNLFVLMKNGYFIFRSYLLRILLFQRMASFQSPSPSSTKLKPLSPFVSKLQVLLSDSKFQDAIRWSGNGEAIVIYDADTFKRIVLDKTAEMFKTKNFTSFVRQLNLYGFRKVPTNGKSDPNKNMKFEHPHFVQSKPQMMHLVQRTCSSSKKRKTGEILSRVYAEKMSRSEERAGRKGESHARERAAWLNNYYQQATKKRANKVSSSSPNHQLSVYRNEEVFQDNEQLALEYMYQKFKEEQHAVQLLMHLKYSPPNPEVFPTGIWEPQVPQLQTRYSVAYASHLPNTRLCDCLSCPSVYESAEIPRQD